MQSYDNLRDDVIKWKHFPRYGPFVRGIHRSPVNSPHKGQWRGALMFSLICALNKRLSKQSWGWGFETPSRLLWRHCNAKSMNDPTEWGWMDHIYALGTKYTTMTNSYVYTTWYAVSFMPCTVSCLSYTIIYSWGSPSRWLSARRQCLQCVNNGDNAVLH